MQACSGLVSTQACFVDEASCVLLLLPVSLVLIRLWGHGWYILRSKGIGGRQPFFMLLAGPYPHWDHAPCPSRIDHWPCLGGCRWCISWTVARRPTTWPSWWQGSTQAPSTLSASGNKHHYCDVIMTTMASQITTFTIVYSTFHSCAYQRKHQSFASLAFVRGIHRWPVNSPHKWPVTRKMFPFDDVIMKMDLIHKSHNAPVPYPTMHYFLTEMCTRVHISLAK